MSPSLNAAQQQAVQTLSGPLLVLAGAGTGKTRVVTVRVGNLIRHGTHPDRILAVTFTNKAALEMQERIAKLLGTAKSPRRVKTGDTVPARPQIGTFHWTCVQILKRHARVLGYPQAFAIYDRGDQESVARGVLRDLRIHEAVLKPGDFLGVVGRWKNAAVRPERAMELARTDKEHLAASGYRRYQTALRLAGAFDFDDLLLATEQLLSEQSAICEQEASRFDHILVDEYQDTNGSQYRIIKSLAQRHRNLCVVGDDDQSIYGWRGAEVQHILNFRQDWPEAVVVRLEENYRSTAAILSMANTLIAFNTHRHDKVLRPARPNGPRPRVIQYPGESEEAKGVAQEIARRMEGNAALQPRDFAILFRTNEQPRVFETELRKAKLPYVLTGSQSFFDRKEVRDVLAYLRVLDNPRDEVSLLRIINTPPRGLGTKSVETLLAQAVSSGRSVWDVFHDAAVTSGLTEPARRGIGTLLSGFENWRSLCQRQKLSEVVRQVIQDTGYLDEIARLYPIPEEREMRLGSVEELVNAVSEYEAEQADADLPGFLASVALEGREFGSPKEKQLQRNALSLMTYHSAKGLEFPIVYMVGMEEGILPHRKSIEGEPHLVDEERRLCYVGVTRAQDELTFSLSLSRMKWGKARDTHPSRFLYEVTGQADNPNRKKAIQAAAAQTRRESGRTRGSRS
jgi:DNA helicase-2/ATP-dependent DNA helicase PcrA